jgi:hypothetical protein
MFDYPDDVARMVAVMAAAGLKRVSPDDLESLWYSYSESMSAGWIALPSSDADIVQILLREAFARYA